MKRFFRYYGAVATFVCGLSAVVFAQPQHPYRNAATVCIDLKTTDHLSGPAFIAVRDETSRIWLRHGIALNWTQPLPEGCRTVVPLVFDADLLAKAAGNRRALALTIFAGRSRVVYVSIPRAFQMLAQLPEISELPKAGERDLRGGTLIGRVVAHELGHVLLATTSHSSKGLMRPVFGPRDVLSWDSSMTELLPMETERLVMRFNLIPGGTGPYFARRSTD